MVPPVLIFFVIKMEYNTEEESLKVIQLRDKLLLEKEDYDDPNFVRLKIEKKLRDQYNKTSNYNKYLKNGRIDLIDPEDRSQLVTPLKDLQEAYYENYKSRKDRENEEFESNKHQQIKPTTETFYDEDYSSPIPSSDTQVTRPSSSGVKPQHFQNLAMNQQQFGSAIQSPIPQQMLTHSPSPMIPTNQPFIPQAQNQQTQQPIISNPDFASFLASFNPQNQPWPFPPAPSLQQQQQPQPQFQAPFQTPFPLPFPPQQQQFQSQPGASAYQFMQSQMNQMNPAAQSAYYQNLQFQLQQQLQQQQRSQQQSQYAQQQQQQQQQQGINYGDGEILPNGQQIKGPNKPLQPY